MSDYLLSLLNGNIDEAGYVKLFKRDLAQRGFDAVTSSRRQAEDVLAAAGWIPPVSSGAISWSARRMKNNPPKRAVLPQRPVLESAVV